MKSVRRFLLLLSLFALSLQASPVYAWVWTGVGWEVLKDFSLGVASNAFSSYFEDGASSQEVEQVHAQLQTLQGDLQRYETENPDAVPAAEFADLQKMVEGLNLIVSQLYQERQDLATRVAQHDKLLAQLNQQFSRLQASMAKPANSAANAQATSAKADKADKADSQAFKLNYVYRAQGKGDFKPFSNGAVLHSGDTFKVILEAEQAAYVYLFLQDSHGQIVRLFPMDTFGGVQVGNKNPVKAGQRYYLPMQDKSFRLDKNTGSETLYFAAFKQANPVLENFYKAIQRAKKSRKPELQKALQAKFTQVLNWESKGIDDELVQDEPVTWQEGAEKMSVQGRKIVDLCKSCTLVLRFEHR